MISGSHVDKKETYATCWCNATLEGNPGIKGSSETFHTFSLGKCHSGKSIASPETLTKRQGVEKVHRCPSVTQCPQQHRYHLSLQFICSEKMHYGLEEPITINSI